MVNSNKEFFETAKNLTDELEKRGNKTDSERIKNSINYFNGLTDGWNLMYDEIHKVLSNPTGHLLYNEERYILGLLNYIDKILKRNQPQDNEKLLNFFKIPITAKNLLIGAGFYLIIIFVLYQTQYYSHFQSLFFSLILAFGASLIIGIVLLIFKLFHSQKNMCKKCNKFNKITINSPSELYSVVEQLQKSIRNRELKELKQNTFFYHIKSFFERLTQSEPLKTSAESISVFDIEPNKPYPTDYINILFKCTTCGNKIRLHCETYHGTGGKVEVIN